MSYPVWSYWEGPMPPWVRACLETIRRHIPGVQVLDQFSWLKLRAKCDPDKDIDLSRLSPNHRSDYIRALLLWRYGGMWIDADTLVMRNMDDYINLLDRHECVCPRDDFGYLLPGLLLCRASSVIMEKVRHYQTHIARKWTQIDWGSFMVDPLTRVVDDHLDRFYEPPIADVMPVSLDEQILFNMEGSDAAWPEHRAHIMASNPYCFIMAHKTLKDRDLTRPGTVFYRLCKEAMA